MPATPRNLPHLYLSGRAERERYTPPPGPPIEDRPAPSRDRALHAEKLRVEISRAIADGRRMLATRESEIEMVEPGYYLEVRMPSGENEALQRLEDRRRRFELVAVRPSDEDGQDIATVFVPDDQAESLLNKVNDYATEETPKGRPRHEALVAAIDSASLAELRSIYTDTPTLFPPTGTDTWWEVWLRVGLRPQFEAVARFFEIPIRELALEFPEREVVLARATPELLQKAMMESGAVAEVRIAKDTPTVFLNMRNRDQAEWAHDLAEQVEGPPPEAAAVCLLDSGITRGHPLLAPAIAPEDQHTYMPAWGVADTHRWHGHGTGMAGLALYGDLTEVVGTNRRLYLTHRLESVKILPNSGQNEKWLYGAVTADGIAQAEIQAPERSRVICLAITSDDGTAAGKPSSWSAEIDKLSYGDRDLRRLIIVSAGNIRDDPLSIDEYRSRNDAEPIENPAQAWNALTVGAYTEKTNLIAPDAVGRRPLAPAGDLSPTSRTSVSWEEPWPNKPDFVLEGGNRVVRGKEAVKHSDLSLLTTHYMPDVAHFRDFSETSAATALAARMAAQIMAEHPDLWPETVRALMVHSAEWTPEMLKCLGSKPKQLEKRLLLRRYGYGVPDVTRALHSANNDLTLVIQEKIRPYERQDGRIRSHEMHLHRLPWPKELLYQIGDVDVEMRVTLSYFIEPNPGERGWTRRHNYSSHGLRFELKRALEGDDQFRGRINREVRDDSYAGMRQTEEDRWMLGNRLRDLGSIHSDIWRGIAAKLADRDAIGVFPVGGWWKENKAKERWDREVPYALIISIRAPEVDVDLYTPVKAAIQAQIEVA